MERGRGWWTELGGNGDNGKPGNRKAQEEGRPTWSNLLFRPWSDVQEALGKARSEARFQAPTGQTELGKKPPRYPCSCLLHTHLGLGKRVRLLLAGCGHSHILQSWGGGSKKQNNQNHRHRPWAENPGCVCPTDGPPGGSPVGPRQETLHL